MILESYGFVEVCEWHLGRGRSKIEARINNNKFTKKRLFYAFVVNDEAKYIVESREIKLVPLEILVEKR
jgi:hypothetical protein